MSSGSAKGGKRQREHRPDRLGPRVFARGRWMAIDLRPWDGGKPTMRNPKAAGWPAKGERTESPEIAERWKWAYLDHQQREAKARALGRPAATPTLGVATSDYLAEREGIVAPNTWIADQTGMRLLMSEFGGDTRLDEISHDAARKWVLHLARRYAASTVAQYIRPMRMLFRWAKVLDPFEGVPLPTVENTEARAWTDEELRVIREVASKRYSALRRPIELAVGTGGRRRELEALDWQNLDPKTRAVKFTRQVDVRMGGFRRLKGNKARTAVVLPSWWDHHQMGQQGRVVGDQPLPTLVLHRLLREVGLDEAGVGWHSFRHTYARIFLDMTHDILLLKESLGHSSVGITERTYKHFDTDRAASKASQLIYGDVQPLLKVI